MKLYEMTVLKNELKEMLEKEEITQEDFEQNQEMLIEVIKEKAESLIFISNDFDSEIKKIDDFIVNLQQKKDLILKNKQKFDNFVIENMEKLEMKEIKTTFGKVKVKVSNTTDKKQLELGLDAKGNKIPENCYDYIVPTAPKPFFKRKDVKDIEKLGVELKKVIVKTIEIK